MLHRLTTVIKMMPPIPIPLSCPASSVKQISCPAARDSSLVTWLFSPFQPGSREEFTGGKSLYNVMEATRGRKDRRSSWAQYKEEVSIMRADLSQERTTDLHLHFLPSLSCLSASNDEDKEKARRGKDGGEQPFTQRNLRRGRRAHHYWEWKKWLKTPMNTICWFERKMEGISRANIQSITRRPVSPCYSTTSMSAEAHFLQPPFYTSLWPECFMQSLAVENLGFLSISPF